MYKRVVVGSMNQVKVNAIKEVFIQSEVMGIKADSQVSAQPFSDEETIEGAINRALEAKKNGDIGIGLEGGVTETPYGLFLINYGALVDADHNIYVAGGTRIYLPEVVADELRKGRELGDVMDEYAHKTGVRENEGAVGVFTNNQIKRQQIFEHIGRLLYGQLLAQNYIQGE